MCEKMTMLIMIIPRPPFLLPPLFFPPRPQEQARAQVVSRPLSQPSSSLAHLRPRRRSRTDEIVKIDFYDDEIVSGLISLKLQ